MANPPKPLELKRKLGNPGQRKLPNAATTVELVPAIGAPAPITLNSHGREMWHKAQERAVWLSDLDLASLEDFCTTWDEIHEYRAAIAEQGITSEEPIVTPAGLVVGTKLVTNPLIKELRLAQKQIHSIGSLLGFDPTSRSRLGLAEVKTQSKLQELAERRNAR